MTKEILDKINRFTRREFSEEEIYVFSVILCDNDIDRDYECFSDNALEQLKELFIGKTGIFDHNASTSNQNARIFETEIIADNERKTRNGSIYKYLKASAYMVRTDENKNLIAEIDGGIKKEVSISCSTNKCICSVCGADKAKTGCNHAKGKTFNGKLCYVILDDISDAYEWSFVAVPAQVNAGVTKKFSEESSFKSPVIADINEDDEKLRLEIRRLAFFKGGRTAAESAALSAKAMNTSQLLNLRKTYERILGRRSTEIQLKPEPKKEQAELYKI